MTQQTDSDDAPDLAAEAAALFHRCRSELRLPEVLATRIAGDFYATMALVAVDRMRRPLYHLSPSETLTPIAVAGEVRDERTIIQRLRDQLGRGGQ